MKNIILICCVLCAIQLNAQKDSTSCKTIVLVNDVEIAAFIDFFENNYLIYRRCPDTNFVQYNLPISFIKIIRDAEGNTDLLFRHLVKLQSEQGPKAKKKPFRAWMFKHKTRKIVRSISEGCNIKVTFKNASGWIQKIKGKCIELTNEELVIETKTGNTVVIQRVNIEKITIPKIQSKVGSGVRLGLLIGALVFGAAIILIMLLFVSSDTLLSAAGANNPNTAKALFGCNAPGCLLPTLLIIGGIIILIASKPKKINYPFSNDWEIIYPTAEIDLQEFTKQP